MDKPVSGDRREFACARLSEADADPDPFRLFDAWFDTAARGAQADVTAMSLATVDGQGQPSVRVVLLKGVDERGFVFYTDYKSRKGRELRANPKAALCFWWPDQERQVRIEGTVSEVSAQESDAYFATRPRESQLGACTSKQSSVIPGRESLEERLSELEARHAGRPVPRPRRWGGYRLAPTEFEFWQCREHRLHDRLRYRRGADGNWKIERLSP